MLRRLALAIALIFAAAPASAACGFGSLVGGSCIGYILNGTTSFTIPSDWTATNEIDAIAGGGGGAFGNNATFSGSGASGGCYSSAINQTYTIGNAITVQVGAGGGAGTSGTPTGGTGGDSFFENNTNSANTVLAKGGNGGAQSSSGGGAACSTASGTGSTKVAGGVGGNADGNGNSGGGGGGAGGLGSGTPAVGGAGGAPLSTALAGGGGGGNAGGSAGASPAAAATTGGNGGNNVGGTGGGVGGATTVAGSPGTSGGGGGGAGGAASGAGTNGGAGGAGIDFDASHGSGGGGGGGGFGVSATAVGGAGGNYGGGGGGAGDQATAGQNGGAGAAGIIRVVYTPSGGASISHNNLMMGIGYDPEIDKLSPEPINLRIQRGVSAGGAVPVLTTTALSSTEPATNGQVIGTVNATNSPTSYAISSCSGCTSYFAISSSGVLTVTSTGASNITATTYNPQINATNGAGTGPTAGVAVTFTALSASCPYGTGSTDGCNGAVASNRIQANYFTAYNNRNYQAAAFTGSIAGNALSTSGVTGLGLAIGNTVLYSGSPAGLYITAGSGASWTLSQSPGNQTSIAMTAQVHPPWDVAGVDYSVGLPNSVTLTSVLTATLPTGVTRDNTNHFLVVAGSSNITLSNLDFSQGNGWGVDITGSMAEVDIVDCQFGGGTNFQVSPYYAGGNTVQGMIEGEASTHAKIVIENDFIDLGAAVNPTWLGPSVIKNFGSGDVVIEYDAIQNISSRLFFAQGNLTIKYNWLENQNFTSDEHGEWTIFDAGPNPSFTAGTVDVEYNTVTQGTTFGGGQTAPFYLSSGVATNPLVTFPNSIFSNNVVIDNGYSVTVNSVSGSTMNITSSSNQLAATNTFCNALNTCSLTLGSQVSGTTGGSGVWNFTGTLGFSSGTIYFKTISPAAFLSLQQGIYTTVTDTNNYIDPSGSSPALYNASTGVAYQFSSGTGPSTLTNTGNVNLNTNAPTTFLERRDLDPASNDNSPAFLDEAA